MVILPISACSGVGGALLGAINPLKGGGVNANVQAGKNNTQTVGQTSIDERKVVVRSNPKQGESGTSVSQDTVTNYELPVWVWAMFILTWLLGWATDTPGTMLKRLFKRKGD